MHRIDGAGATVDNKFTEGNPGLGTPATVVTGPWLNDVQEELMSLLTAASITPVKGTQNQVLAAVRRISASTAGVVRNARVSVPAFAGSFAYTADEVSVKTALGGQAWLLSGVNKALSGGLTGVGGMDVGTAPVSGAVATYLIYNPNAALSATNPALLGVNATSIVAPEVYGGANMPAGYTASALVSVWRTTPGTAFDTGYQLDRNIWTNTVQVLSTTTMQASLTSLPLAAAVPRNAKTFRGIAAITSTVTPANLSFAISGAATPIGQVNMAITNSAVNGGLNVPFPDVPLVAAQTAFYSCATSAGTATLVISSTGYSF